jgi:chromosome segregation ATPase
MRRPDKNAQSDRLEALNVELSGKIQSLEQSLGGKIEALQQAADMRQQQVLSAISQVSASFEKLAQMLDRQSTATAQLLTASESLLQMSTELSSKESALENVLLERMQSLQQALVEEIQRQHSLLKISHISASLETLQRKFEEQSTPISQISSLSDLVQRLQGQVDRLHALIAQRLPALPTDGRPSLDALQRTRDQRMANATAAINDYQQSEKELQEATQENERIFQDLHRNLMMSAFTIAPDAARNRPDTRAIGQSEMVIEASSSDNAGKEVE